jgi:hypothetical protein
VSKFNNLLLWHFAAASALLVVAPGAATRTLAGRSLRLRPGKRPAAFDATTQLTVTPATDATQNFNFTGCRQ